MICDFHCRIYEKTELQRISEREKALPFSDGSFSDLSEKEEACGVYKFVVLNGGAALSGTAIPFYTVKDPADEKLPKLRSLGYYGICVDPEELRIPVDDRRLSPVFECASALGLAVCVRCGGHHFSEYAYCSPDRLCAVSDRYEGSALIFSHLGGCRSRGGAAELLQRKNVYFDTASCVFGVSVSFIGQIISEYADKILFGSDMPWCSPALICAFLNCAGVSGKERELIERGNAENLLSSIY